MSKVAEERKWELVKCIHYSRSVKGLHYPVYCCNFLQCSGCTFYLRANWLLLAHAIIEKDKGGDNEKQSCK